MTGFGRDLKVIVATSAVILITAFLWRALYEFGDVSLVSLIPLSILMLTGSYITILGSRRASLDSILSESTSVRHWLKGRIVAAVLSLIVTAVGIFLLAYKALVAQSWELLVSVLCVLTTSVFFLKASRMASPHVNQKYLLTAATNMTVVTAGTLFFFVYIYSLWNFQKYPEYILSDSLLVSIERALSELPQGIGPAAGLFEIAAVIEISKSWLVVKSESLFGFAPAIYIVYGALFGYFQVRAVASVVCSLIMILNGYKLRV